MKRRWSPRLRVQIVSWSLTALLLSNIASLPCTGTWQAAAKATPAAPSAREVTARQDFSKLPLSFEPNQGQTDAQVKFMARGSGYGVFLTADEAVLTLQQHKAPKTATEAVAAPENAVVRLKVIGANQTAAVNGQAPLPGKNHYFKGNDRSQWRTDIPTFARVQYGEIYPGVDLVYYGQQRQLEYDFIVAPGADAEQIALRFDGADSLKLNGNGDLVLETAAGELRQHAPVIYQETSSGKQFISGGYKLAADQQITFALGDYDHNLPLVIDPVFGYASFLGGTGFDMAAAAAVDADGNLFVTGETADSLFPGTNVFSGASSSVFVTKLDPGGSTVLFTTLLEGRSREFSSGIAVDATGNIYVAGTTISDDFPLQLPFEDKLNHGILPCFGVLICIAYWYGSIRYEGFVTKLNPTGNQLLFSTYMGGADDDFLNGLALSADGKVYVTGSTRSLNFPIKNEFQNNTVGSGFDSFITVLANNGQSLVYSSYLRGTYEAKAVAVDSAGNAYITGYSDDNQLPVKGAGGAAPFRSSNAGGNDAYVAKFNPAATGDASLVYATYLGGGGTDQGFAIAVDAQNRAFVTGVTGSVNFPLQSALDTTNVVNEAFVTGLNANGSGLVFSTFLGGSGAEAGTGIAFDRSNNIVVAGHTTSTNFTLSSPIQTTAGGGRDGFVTKLAPNGASILFSTYVGGNQDDQINGVAVDAVNSIYVVGQTRSANMPSTPNAVQTFLQGGLDAWAGKITFALPETIGVFTAGAAFNLRNSLSAGPPDITAFFGAPTDQPIVGDWNGDGVKTIGLFRDGTFFLHNRNESTGTPDLQFSFGQAGDIPIVGDWDGDGVDTIGVYRRASSLHFSSLFLLRNSNSSGAADITVSFGSLNDAPLAGDWNGDGVDTIGLFRKPVGTATATTFLLRNSNTAGTADITVNFGTVGDLPVVGDWDGNLTDTIGLFRDGVFTLRKFNNTGSDSANQVTIGFGATGDRPLAGDWDGLP